MPPSIGHLIQLRSPAIYVFHNPSVPVYQRFVLDLTLWRSSDDPLPAGPLETTIPDLWGIPPHSGAREDMQLVFAYQRRENNNAYYYFLYAEAGDQLKGSETFRAVPRVAAPQMIPDRLTEPLLQARRKDVKDAFALNADATPSVLTYLQEAYYYVPMYLAMQLQIAGQFLAALDWYRTV